MKFFSFLLSSCIFISSTFHSHYHNLPSLLLAALQMPGNRKKGVSKQLF
jgi:hypothetical protein